jgi:enterochelin esterase-like enzyme
MLLTRLSVFGGLAAASVTVRKTAQGPTGYEVTFRYENATASSITIASGLMPFTDSYHATPIGSARYDPHKYQPGWFLANGAYGPPKDLPYQMTNLGNGSWTYTTPLPSGTYNYAYLVDCLGNTTCSIDTGGYVIDPDEPPFVNVQGDQTQSTFQVPFDPDFQYDPDLNLNFDYALPVDEAHRGTVRNVNYTSPGSIHPAQDVHDFAIYLPHGYTNGTSQKYPILYLSHGGGGAGQDWENLARASHILDRLIQDGHITPTVVVMPTFYNIAPEYKQVYGSRIPPAVAPSAPVVRENYMKYLMPFVERTFAVSTTPSERAFAGLSLGGRLTYEMYINATDYFGYFGIFSGATFGGPGSYVNASMLAANPALRQKGIYTSVGLYDFAFDDIRGLEEALQSNGVPFLGRVVPFGYHAWNTWQDCLWFFGKKALWKGLPFKANPVVSLQG